jgi:thioredoxin-related protein
MMSTEPCRWPLLALLLIATGLTAAEGPWREDLDQALADSSGRPLALLLSSEHCQWCQRMLAESAESPEVKQALTQVVGLHVDLDRYPGLAAQLAVRSVPTLVLINRKRELVRMVPGYLTAADLATALRVLALHGDQEGRTPVALQAGVDVAALLKQPEPEKSLLPLLGTGDPETRRALRAALAKLPQARAGLWQGLEAPALGVRVDAAAVLAEQVGPPTRYDPFADPEERRAGLREWRRAAGEAAESEMLP